MNALIKHIYISPGHNYFGHYGKPPGENPIVEVEQIECVAGRGIRGDRFFDYKEDYKGQITFFSYEVFIEMKKEFNLPPEITPACTRRNVIVEGVDLNRLVGMEFEIQGIRFLGTEECKPCF
ncbi:MAG: MOSC domain-containing protein [Verrucomicrobiia bacterium]